MAEPPEPTGAEPSRGRGVLDLDPEESGGADVDGRAGPAGLDALGHRQGGADRDGVGLGRAAGAGGPGRGGGVHADDLAVGVDQGAARVTGLDVAVHLDEAVEVLRVAATAVAGGDRLVERR